MPWLPKKTSDLLIDRWEEVLLLEITGWKNLDILQFKSSSFCQFSLWSSWHNSLSVVWQSYQWALLCHRNHESLINLSILLGFLVIKNVSQFNGTWLDSFKGRQTMGICTHLSCESITKFNKIKFISASNIWIWVELVSIDVKSLP